MCIVLLGLFVSQLLSLSSSKLVWKQTVPKLTTNAFVASATDGKGNHVVVGAANACSGLFAVSNNDGKTWYVPKILSHPSPPGGRCNTPMSAMYTQEKGFLVMLVGDAVLGTPAETYVSTDAKNWKHGKPQNPGLYPRLTFLNGQYYCPIESAYGRQPHQEFATSTDGITWTNRSIVEIPQTTDASLSMWGGGGIRSNNYPLYLNSGDDIVYSTDGDHWESYNVTLAGLFGKYGSVNAGAFSSKGINLIIGIDFLSSEGTGIKVYVYKSTGPGNHWSIATQWNTNRTNNVGVDIKCMATKPVCLATPRGSLDDAPKISTDGGNTWEPAPKGIGAAVTWDVSGDTFYQFDYLGNFNWTSDLEHFQSLNEGLDHALEYLTGLNGGVMGIGGGAVHYSKAGTDWPVQLKLAGEITNGVIYDEANQKWVVTETKNYRATQYMWQEVSVHNGQYKASKAIMLPKYITNVGDIAITTGGGLRLVPNMNSERFVPVEWVGNLYVYSPNSNTWSKSVSFKGFVNSTTQWLSPWAISNVHNTVQVVGCDVSMNPFPSFYPCVMLRGKVSASGIKWTNLGTVYNGENADAPQYHTPPPCFLASVKGGALMYSTCSPTKVSKPLHYSTDGGMTWYPCLGNSTVVKSGWTKITYDPIGIPCGNKMCPYIAETSLQYGDAVSEDGITWNWQEDPTLGGWENIVTTNTSYVFAWRDIRYVYAAKRD